MDIGIAVDTDDGLFCRPCNADMLDARGIREGVNRLREQVESRSIAASELSGYTISLSNFGMFAGRYATRSWCRRAWPSSVPAVPATR